MNLEDYQKFWNEIANGYIRERVAKIGNMIQKTDSCDFIGIDEFGRFQYDYWDGDGTSHDTISPQLVFSEEYIKHTNAELEARERAKAAIEARKQLDIAAEERRRYEELKKKFEKT